MPEQRQKVQRRRGTPSPMEGPPLRAESPSSAGVVATAALSSTSPGSVRRCWVVIQRDVCAVVAASGQQHRLWRCFCPSLSRLPLSIRLRLPVGGPSTWDALCRRPVLCRTFLRVVRVVSVSTQLRLTTNAASAASPSDGRDRQCLCSSTVQATHPGRSKRERWPGGSFGATHPRLAAACSLSAPARLSGSMPNPARCLTSRASIGCVAVS